MFRLTDVPITQEPIPLEAAGGFVTFEGKVRNHAMGRSVIRLEYEAFPDLAIPEGVALLEEAKAKYGLLSASVIHRTGLLEVGDTAVLIQVAAAHRHEAFAGCEWIIDQLKHRVPIWKKEHFADGDSGWVGADVPSPNEDLYRALVQRQRSLEEVGEVGQTAIREAKVLMVGVGGLASGCLPYLAGAGIGTIGMVDPDVVDLTNLHRQILYGSDDVGRLKVDRAANFARRINPTVTIHSHPEELSRHNVDRLIADYDWVIDGTDSLETKYLLNAACHRLNKHLVSASVHRFEGQLMTIAPGGPCLRCLFPQEPPVRCVSNCAETGIIGLIPGLFGLLQANEVLKGILGYGSPLTHQLQIIDLRTGDTMHLVREARPDCPVCSGGPEQVCSAWEVSSLEDATARLGACQLIDVRELDELPPLPVPHIKMPMSALKGLPDGPLVLVCATGSRSLQLVARFQAEGRTDILSLKGGVSGTSSGIPSC